MIKYVIKVVPETIDAVEQTDEGFRKFTEWLLTWPQTKEFLEIFIPRTTLFEINEKFGGVEIVEA